MSGLANTLADRLSGEDRDRSDVKDVSHLVEKLMDPEADYHREGGAGLMGTTPEDMTKEQRSDIKSVNFAVPYGMGAYSLAERKHGIAENESDKKKYLEEAEMLLASWKKFNWQINGMLEAYRENSLKPVADDELPASLRGKKLGRVINELGRRRYFELDNLTGKGTGRIRRQSGNYPIQSLARDYFVYGYVRINKRIEKEGLADKIFIPNLVHDEMGMIVHRSIPKEKIYEMISEECVLHIKGHPTYFAGISMVDNWYQGKDDLYEAPPEFVELKVKEFKEGKTNFNGWESNATQDTLTEIREFMIKRYMKEIGRAHV